MTVMTKRVWMGEGSGDPTFVVTRASFSAPSGILDVPVLAASAPVARIVGDEARFGPANPGTRARAA